LPTACFKSETAYKLKVSAYLGSSLYESDLSSISVTNQDFYVESLASTAANNSISVSWLPPRSDVAVSGYVVWLTRSSMHNGYDAARNSSLYYGAELRATASTKRLVLDSSSRNVSFSGCYSSSAGASECIVPWTLYRVFVAPVSTSFSGKPLYTDSVTAAAAPVSPVNLTAVRP
jgi:hypothetical protein